MTEQITRPWVYLATFAALVVLTVATVSLSMLRLSPWHLAIGSMIGAVKAVLVALFFMQLSRGPGRTWLAAGLGLFWLAILIALLMTDYATRAGSSI
jgi:cytochrome c oxidase subunit IV